MRWLVRTLTSSIGRKVLVALTGFFLIGYLIVHVSGNMMLYAGAEKFNDYATELHAAPWLLPVEIALYLAFAAHIILVIKITLENRAARGENRYLKLSSKRSDSARTLASKVMMWSGAFVLVFLIVHVWEMRIKHGGNTEQLAQTVTDLLSTPWRGVFYIVASLLVGWHVFHGMASAFRSIGVNHPGYTPAIQKIAAILSAVIALLFASIPLMAMLGKLSY